jgi:hypothetical protein
MFIFVRPPWYAAHFRSFIIGLKYSKCCVRYLINHLYNDCALHEYGTKQYDIRSCLETSQFCIIVISLAVHLRSIKVLSTFQYLISIRTNFCYSDYFLHWLCYYLIFVGISVMESCHGELLGRILCMIGGKVVPVLN